MRVRFIDNCRLVFSLSWKVLAHLSEIIHSIDNMIGRRGRFSEVVMPMSIMAGLITLLSVIVFSRDYQHAVAEMLYIFGSFLLIYILFVSVLNFFASRSWFTDDPKEFAHRAKSFVICLLLVHFDVVLISAVAPSFRIAELFEFYVIFVSWNMTGSYLPVSRHRSAFGIISGASLLLFNAALHKILSNGFPNMPI